MTSKQVKYKTEQDEICKKILAILQLDQNNSFYLRDIDSEKQKKITDLTPDIKKYFVTRNIIGISKADCTNPHMSITRKILKSCGYEVTHKSRCIRDSSDPTKFIYTRLYTIKPPA
ncbi:MAG: hypothetical protein Faunusvirus34_2 [Faunusvirus sp.]|jgi:hypothetical protein|uniref:Uncharacterized protein n=1 Tax=Faunusvirus sp. TaxID=2487766 RepID=A0A3G4ZXL4_9VIRU|nr:MAG: hypothetical protein Faunusvirus34_2 [Faunusvirus sp.]